METLDLLRHAEPGERFHPHTIPLYLVDRLVKAHGLKAFIESGTYLGATIEHVLDQFERIVTIELDPKLAAAARWKFEAHQHVTVLEGDSGRHLAQLFITPLRQRALIWLDAHYSGGVTVKGSIDTPIRAELEALRGDGQHVLMIDDIDDFNGEHGYPTHAELMDLVYFINLSYDVRILPIRRGVLVALPPK